MYKHVRENAEKMMRDHPQVAKAADYLMTEIGKTVEEVYKFLYGVRFERPERILVLAESQDPIRRRLTRKEYDELGIRVLGSLD